MTRILTAIVALAVLLRFATLDAKSFWQDEAETAFLAEQDVGDMLREVRDLGATPPFYYLVARAWAALFGTGEVGLRSLSALAGVAAVPVAYLVGRELVSRRVGLVVAALVAVNPLLIWYSQEARSYALLFLLSGIGFLFFARSLHDPSRRNLALWGVSSSLALATHYFAAFPFAAEAVWLLYTRVPRYPVLLAAGPVTATGVALLPFVLHQEAHFSAGDPWIEDIGLVSRVVQIPGIFVVGFETPLPYVAAGIGAALVGLGVWLLAARASPEERSGAVIAGAVGVGALALPLGLSILGFDYLNYKNVIPALLPLAILPAAGLGAARAGPIGIAATAGLVALSLAIDLATAWEPKYGREDWRSATAALGPARTERLLVVTPGPQSLDSLGYYLPRATLLEEGDARVREIDLLALPRRGLGAIAEPRLPTVDANRPPPAPGFRLAERRTGHYFDLLRYRSVRPVRVRPDALRDARLDDVEPAVLLEPAR